jgi:lipoate---protein ligase
MQCLISTNQDIYFNLAMEEYLLLHGENDFFVLWQSIPAVIVGKHQNALAEVNLRFVRENNIRLARRLSGGGTVFHGPGNLNFTYIARGETGKLVDFSRFIMPVIQFLETLGIKAEFGTRNEILVNGKKVSGNAEHVHKNRVLHHGTLLFNADLSMLRESIRVLPGRYTDKAVQSNRSSVINLADYLPASLDLEIFSRLFLQFILDRFNGKKYRPNEEILSAVEELSSRKYRSWEWIYGWSPDYEFRSEAGYADGILRIYLKVHRGRIVDCTLHSAGMPDADLNRLKGLLLGNPHEPENLMSRIRESNLPGCRDEHCIRELVYGFF